MGSSFNFYITSFAGVYGPLDSDRTYSHVSITLPLEAERLQYMLPVLLFFFCFVFVFSPVVDCDTFEGLHIIIGS